MKLYLSSYGVGKHPEKLLELLGPNINCALIMNAQDLKEPAHRSDSYKKSTAELTSLGLNVEELDLRNYFNGQGNLKADLLKYGLIWVRGGNAFVLRRAMRQSGFDKIISELVRSEQIVYGGFSAGTCVTAPTLRGIELVDDPQTVPESYDSEIIWEGLGLIDYSIAPHYRSGHYESAAVEKTVEYFKAHKIPHKTLHDGQAIVINGPKCITTP